jgi:lipopolysaccharide transport system permease protein
MDRSATPAALESDSPAAWDLIIRPQSRWWNIQLADLWAYRDLIWMFVRRDFVSVYKQTILGPLWFLIQPVLTTLMFTVVFSGIAHIPTDGFPPMLFYLAGMTPWNYFAACLNKTSGTFVWNANLFGKVYFPRLITPLSVVISNLIQFGIQFALFIGFLAYFAFADAAIEPAWRLIFLLTPVLLVLMGALGLAAGVLVSSLTTKYRDLTFLVSFGVQLAMFATPVIYPASQVPDRYRALLALNPVSAIVESFRAIYLGGTVPWAGLGVSAAVTVALLLVAVAIFSKVERSFMDTV